MGGIYKAIARIKNSAITDAVVINRQRITFFIRYGVKNGTKVRKKHNINILAVKTGGKINATITSDTILSEENTILVLGEFKALQKCFRI